MFGFGGTKMTEKGQKRSKNYPYNLAMKSRAWVTWHNSYQMIQVLVQVLGVLMEHTKTSKLSYSPNLFVY